MHIPVRITHLRPSPKLHAIPDVAKVEASALTPRPRCRGANMSNLRSLRREPLTTNTTDLSAPARIGLVNARSLVNKIFILKDFFMSQRLDLLYITETWLSAGDTSAFSELLPHDCCFFNTPRTSGWGGGIATVFKNGYKCRQLSFTFPSFELSATELGHSPTVLCTVVYRPPKYNKDFINDFSDFLT